MTKIIQDIDFSNDDCLIDNLGSINEESSSIDDFPVNVFPQDLQKIVTAANRALGYPKAFLSGGILFAASVAIGNSYKLRVKNDWKEPAILYVINVGSPGTNKTHPVKFALGPLMKLDEESYKKYTEERRVFEELSSLPSKEREKKGKSEPVKVTWKKILVSDFTPEGLIKIHESNPRSLGVYVDEALSWISNFGRYNKGSEGPFWLSNFSQTPITVDRKGSHSILLTSPFISIIGNIQPTMLRKLAAENRDSNGLLDRLLFVYPENVLKEYWSDEELDPSIVQTWTRIVRRIMDLEYHPDINGNFSSNEITFSTQARRVIQKWQRTNADLSNNQHEEHIKSIYSKMEIFAVRFSMILQILRWACDDAPKDCIAAETAEAAITLTEYFRKTALRVHSSLKQPSAEKLPELKKTIFNVLPETFKTSEGLAIATKYNFPRRTFEDFLKDESIFKKIKHGTYEKIKQ